MPKQVLQITLSKFDTPKSKLGKWWFWKVYFPVWKVWKPKVLSKFYHALSIVFLSMIPKSQREEYLKEFEDIEIVLKDERHETKKE